MASEKKDAKPRRPPATTVEARENQVIAQAYDLAEKQIRDGSASSQVVTHFLKLGTVRESLEREKLRRENKLLEARTEGMESAKRVEELYDTAISAMRRYAGHDVEEMDD